VWALSLCRLMDKLEQWEQEQKVDQGLAKPDRWLPVCIDPGANAAGERRPPVPLGSGGLAVSTLRYLASYSLNLVKSPVKVLFADDQRRREPDSAADDLTV
jgi:hypothetical protein